MITWTEQSVVPNLEGWENKLNELDVGVVYFVVCNYVGPAASQEGKVQ
jgi:hypothetical protein